MKIRDKANNWVPPPKITDIPKIPVDAEIYDDGEGINLETDKPYTYSYMMLNDKEIRVPDSVISQLHEQLKENPKMTYFKVTKKGEGLLTKYTVIPLLE